MGTHIIRPFKILRFEFQPLARDKIQEICGSGYTNDPDPDRSGKGTEEVLGHRRLLAFLRGPPEQRLPVPLPRDKRER